MVAETKAESPSPPEGTAVIPLTRALVVTVDLADFEWLNRWKWCALRSGKLQPKYFAVRSERVGGNEHLILMHRLMVSALPGEIVNFRDGDSLNLRRTNLRLGSHKRQALQRRKRASSVSSPFKGVSGHAGKWIARFNGEYLGSFASELDAARAYDRAALVFDKDYARTNGLVSPEEVLGIHENKPLSMFLRR